MIFVAIAAQIIQDLVEGESVVRVRA